MGVSELEHQIAAIASLDEPVRRCLYRYVVRQRGDVGRDEAARAVGISRALAAFHLDKLVERGLLATSFRRLTGRQGPGAGRPAKLYRRSDGQLTLALPPRRYELMGRVFARALAASSVVPRDLERVARDTGRRLGAAARRLHAATRPTATRLLARLTAVLAEWGYEPLARNGEIRLRNCPFDALANECRPLVCGTNLALLRGLLAGLGVRAVQAELHPEPGSCCAVLRATRRRTR
ncbi:MAG TPA: hypothetical protein VM716_08820 [Gemmatimonadales bacterium]|nr:hypothetical protein [Gemmatimonadales bacterium]